MLVRSGQRQILIEKQARACSGAWMRLLQSHLQESNLTKHNTLNVQFYRLTFNTANKDSVLSPQSHYQLYKAHGIPLTRSQDRSLRQRKG